MTIEALQELCRQMSGVTESIEWDHNLCFCVAGKMFLVVGLDTHPTTASFKVTPEEFAVLGSREGFMPAPYLARYKWVALDNLSRLQPQEWKNYVQQSYRLIVEKLPKKLKQELDK